MLLIVIVYALRTHYISLDIENKPAHHASNRPVVVDIGVHCNEDHVEMRPEPLTTPIDPSHGIYKGFKECTNKATQFLSIQPPPLSSAVVDSMTKKYEGSIR